MDDRLSLSVTHADGRITRWGPDEVDAGNVPSDLTFSTSMPGGFRDLSCSLLRRIDLDYADQGLFDNVRAYGPGNRTAWDGRFTQFPRSHGQGFSVTPGAIGWAAHLRDDPTFREIYVDRDITRWGPMSRARRIALYSSSIVPMDAQVAPDASSEIPALSIEWQDQPAVRWIGEGLYDSGVLVGSIYYDIARDNTTEIQFYVGDDADSYLDGSGNLSAGGTGTYTPATSRRFAHVLAERGADPSLRALPTSHRLRRPRSHQARHCP
jgi:hypothetical protein